MNDGCFNLFKLSSSRSLFGFLDLSLRILPGPRGVLVPGDMLGIGVLAPGDMLGIGVSNIQL